MTHIDTMKQALEALESYAKSPYIKHQHPKRKANGDKAITALRLAIEQAEAEKVPVGSLRDKAYPQQAEKQAALEAMADNARETGLDYTAPPQRQPLTNSDTVRLDWLTFNLSGKALRDIGVVWSEHSNARAAIDEAMAAYGIGGEA